MSGNKVLQALAKAAHQWATDDENDWMGVEPMTTYLEEALKEHGARIYIPVPAKDVREFEGFFSLDEIPNMRGQCIDNQYRTWAPNYTVFVDSSRNG